VSLLIVPDTYGPIRTYKTRRGRMTATQRAALNLFSDYLIPEQPLDILAIWGAEAPLMLDIGFGDGVSTVALAESNPSAAILAIDVHTPGVADLLHAIATRNITNIRVMHADAVHVLKQFITPGSVESLQTLFLDPWPKSRHHKRRFVQPAIVDLVRQRLQVGGTWNLASDWMPYVETMIDVFTADDHWSGGVVPRPDRPMTHYEARALRDGRTVMDLHMTRVA
jgi:tRNA (guanine-N7-)-methyltransferase